MKKSILGVITITIIAKIIGFSREIVLSYFYGTSNISDAYLIALMIPTIIFTFIGSAISTGYIPIYNKVVKIEGDTKAKVFTGNLLNIIVLINILIVAIGLFFTDTLVLLFASGFDGETFKLATGFLKFSLVGMLFMGATYLFRSFLFAEKNI